LLVIKEDFQSKFKRININKVPKTERKSQEEIKQTSEKVHEDRKFQIDAGIVKLMKEHKVLTHNDLMQKLIERLKFPIDSS